jgi:ribulose bisphosphate carboxylase small subunit
MNWFKKFVYNLQKRTFYITFEWTDKEANRVQSWIILETPYNLNKRKDLHAFIMKNDKEKKDYYITWFKELS